MKFPQRDWVTEIATATITAAAAAAPMSAIVVVSGVLAIGFATFAAMNGYNIGDLCSAIYPRFRGGQAAELPRAAYVIFFAYVIAATELALILRRRMTNH
ncbi:MAG TPA: hypothetical protein VJ032_08130 [Thermoanaerobaculia bacterium]|nr:hypothetical protein [Thermoanaerobaculia bacterium]